MKKILPALLLLSNLAFSQGQPWCQPGATWHYSAAGLPGHGYLVLSHIGTTQINNQICDNFSATLYVTYPLFSIYQHSIFNTYIENNKVYAYSTGLNFFFKLYDFGAQVGDSWYIYPNSPGFCVEDSSLVHVDSISQYINGIDTLKKFHVSYSLPIPAYSFGDSFIEKLGGSNYLFPVSTNCLYDGIDANQLRCYTDSSNWFYQNAAVGSCIPTAIKSPTSTNAQYKLSVLPNPAERQFKLQIPLDFNWNKLQIYSSNGIEVLTFSNTIHLQELLLSPNFSKGIYFVKIINAFGGQLTTHLIIN